MSGTDMSSHWAEVAAQQFELNNYRTPGQLAINTYSNLVQTPALELIDRKLVDLTRADGRLILSMPPQEGKSERCSFWFPIWALIRNPYLRIGIASYSMDLARRWGRRIRDEIELHGAQYGLRIKQDVRRQNEWFLDNGIGGVFTAGIDGGITGRPVDLLIIDDPIKNREEADSPRQRERVWDFWTTTAQTRLPPKASVLLVMTRWHKDDLAGMLLKPDPELKHQIPWEYLNVPAQAVNEDDPLGRDPGQWMISARGRTVQDWENRRASTPPRDWQALYQGDPKPIEGSYIDVSKIDVIPWENVVYKDPHGFLQTMGRALVVQSWDLTFGSTGKNNRANATPTVGDYVAGHVYAVIGQKWILIDRVHGRFTFTQQISEILKMSARWPQTSRIYVENAANGAAAIDSLRSRAALITPVTPKGSKESRALAVQPIIDEGNYAVLDTVYNESMFEEYRDFPSGKHDDDVDAMTQAINNGKQDYFRMEGI